MIYHLCFLCYLVVQIVFPVFLIGLSIGPIYFFLIRVWVTEEGTEIKMTAINGFFTGHLMLFISVYYEPLHLALIRHHTITMVILRYVLRYLFFKFVHKNNKHYYSDYGYKLDSGYENPDSISKFSMFKAFLNNLFFQLLNPLLFPSSILIRLMNINLFRSKHNLLFLTSTFGGWFIGHIFLTRYFELLVIFDMILLGWLLKNNSLQFDKYLLLQMRNYAGELFILVSFVIFARYSGFDQYVIFVYRGF